MSKCKCEASKIEKCGREIEAAELCKVCIHGCAELRLGAGVVLFAAAQLVAAHVPAVIRLPEE